MAFTVLGKRRRRRTKELWLDTARFVTGAEKTEGHHVEAAFAIRLETAELVITEFRESRLDHCANPTNPAGSPEPQNKRKSATGECRRWFRVEKMVYGLGHEGSLRSILFWTARGATYCLLTLLGWY